MFDQSVLSAEEHLDVREGEKILFVASTGGHLAQLNRFSELYAPASESCWVTFNTPQSRSLLFNRRRFFVPYVKPRDFKGVLRTTALIRGVLKNGGYDRVVSTGAGIALSAFIAGRSLGIPCRYIESVSRVKGPSLTGRITERLRLADMYTQHQSWASRKWKTHPSVLAQFEPAARTSAPQTWGPQIFVTLGTIRPYRFDAAVNAILATGLVNDSTIWQLGSTTAAQLPGRIFQEMSAAEFNDAASSADIVITHAGVGTILELLEMGIHPVVLPRRREFGEHVDDHQLQITELVSSLGIGTAVEPEQLTRNHLLQAAHLATVAVKAP